MVSHNKTWEEAVLQLREDGSQKELVKACFYDDPISDCASRYYHSSEWLAIQELLQDVKPGLALDIGAGRGISSYALAKDAWKVTALEPDSSNIVGAGMIRKLAIDENLDITVVEEFGEELPFEDNYFDLVHARQVLHHANNLTTFCNEISRVLKPGGRLIATREHVISHSNDLDVFLDQHPLHNLYGGEHAYKLKEYIHAIQNSGIRLSQILSPFESNINLYPATKITMYKVIENKLKIPLPKFIMNIILKLYGYKNNTPGRLYSFVGEKK